MGNGLVQGTTLELIAQKNRRFGEGDAIREMAELQREFKIFSADHSLYASFTLLDIRPTNPAQAPVWRKWLDFIKTYPSDRDKVNGHDRWRQAYQENLEASVALPMFITVHNRDVDPRVTVTTDRPLLFIPNPHVIVSMPAIPR